MVMSNIKKKKVYGYYFCFKLTIVSNWYFNLNKKNKLCSKVKCMFILEVCSTNMNHKIKKLI